MPADSKMLDLLRDIDVFANLDEAQMTVLAEISSLQAHKSGKIVFRQGDTSDNFQIVSSGRLDCYLWDDLLNGDPCKIIGRIQIQSRIDIRPHPVEQATAIYCWINRHIELQFTAFNTDVLSKHLLNMQQLKHNINLKH